MRASASRRSAPSDWQVNEGTRIGFVKGRGVNVDRHGAGEAAAGSLGSDLFSRPIR